ncbi:hypothetical protein JCM10450v2_003596 [Rhodotorula kratochvilovae]
MPATPATQPCEVCGELTTLRCAACQKAGIDLSFCSKEHQKLVWQVHKAVCGPSKACPIAVEPLTDAEIDMARRQLDEMVSVGQAGAATLREKLEAFGKKPGELVLEQLRGDVYDTTLLADKPLLVTFMRCIIGQLVHIECDAPSSLRVARFGHGDEFEEFNAERTNKFVANITWTVCEWIISRRVLPRGYASETWFSLLQHKALILGHIFRLETRAYPGEPDEELLRGVTDRFVAWVKSGMGTNNPLTILALPAFRLRFSILPPE